MRQNLKAIFMRATTRWEDTCKMRKFYLKVYDSHLVQEAKSNALCSVTHWMAPQTIGFYVNLERRILYLLLNQLKGSFALYWNIWRAADLLWIDQGLNFLRPNKNLSSPYVQSPVMFNSWRFFMKCGATYSITSLDTALMNFSCLSA